MKKLQAPFIFSCACLLLALSGLARPARAESSRTYSDTRQSNVVRGALRALQNGNMASFREALSDRALALYGSNESIQRLQQLFQKVSEGVSSIETRTDRNGLWNGDSFVLLSSRIYSVDLLGRRAGELDPLWTVSVKCYTLSLTESFGGPAAHCTISDLSMGAQSEAQGSASVNSRAQSKELDVSQPSSAADAVSSKLSTRGL